MQQKHSRKKTIIEIIKNKEQVKISELLVYLKNYKINVNQRTILRDLNGLIKKKIISKGGLGKNIFYFISNTNKIFEEIDKEKYFRTDYNKRLFQETFNFNIFEILENDVFTKEEKEVLKNHHKQFIKNFSKYNSQTLINKEFERIMIEFSWKSSAIEGNTYSLLGTEALFKENVKEEGKTAEETQMILNHKDVFNETIQNKSRFLKLQYNDIEYIHTVLTKNLDIRRNIRNLLVRITGTKYKPLDNSYQIKEALEKMINLINKKESFFEKAFLSLLLLSYIQAFEDGNKRTARMFSNAILLANNSVPLSYRIVDVIEYKEASLLFYEINNIFYFKQIFIDQFKDSVNNYFL